MKFISAKQFLSADKKVRDGVMAWWKPETGDIVYNNDGYDAMGFVCGTEMYDIAEIIDEDCEWRLIDENIIPLLTVGQLIEYLEHKAGGVEIKITCENSKETLLDTLWEEVLRLG